MIRPLRMILALMRDEGFGEREHSARIVRHSAGRNLSGVQHQAAHLLEQTWASRQNAENSGQHARAPHSLLKIERSLTRNSSAQIENCHAHRETVGDLVENHALQAVGDFAVDLDPAVDRSGMHDQAVGLQKSRAVFR